MAMQVARWQFVQAAALMGRMPVPHGPPTGPAGIAMSLPRQVWLDAIRWVAMSAAIVVAAIVSPLRCAADDNPTPRELDVWGRFGAGSWKSTRITTETVDESGKVTATSTCQQRIKLTSVDAHHVALRITVTMETDGRRFDTEPQTVDHGYYGENAGQTVQLKDLGKASLKIDGSEYPCQSREASIESDGRKTECRIFQSSFQAPYLLRRETHITDAANPSANNEETSEVIAVDMPYRVGTEIKPVSFERSIQKNAKGSTVTLDVTSVDVPGGIASRMSTERETHGHVIRRVTMDLIDYHAVEEDQQPDAPRRRLFHRRRS